MVRALFKKKWVNLTFFLALALLLSFITWYRLTYKNLNDYKSQLSLELSNGKYSQAVLTINKILELVKTDEEKCKYYLLLGDIYFYSLKRYQKGIDSYEKSLKYAHKNSIKKRVFISLSKVYESIGDFDRAIYYLNMGKNSSENMKEKIEIDLKIIELYKETKRYEKALIGYKRLLRRELPNGLRCQILFNIGLIYFLNKNFSSSIEYFKKEISSCSDNFYNITNRAKLLLMESYEFIEDYDNALSILKNIPDKFFGKEKKKRKIMELKRKKNGIKFNIKKFSKRR